jgi:nicotinate-nucleotide pyrophosphorylase (carboxylating)
VVVVGSGVAGLTTTALTACRRLPWATVVLVTKSLLETGSTRWAQGGIAAALDDRWLGHLVVTAGEDGPAVRFEQPRETPDGAGL